MDQQGRFCGTGVVVTGGAHGIGQACAARFSEEGARVVVTDLDLEEAQRVATALPDQSRLHLALHMDVTDRSSVDDAIAQARRDLGQIDVVVNVAGGDTDYGRFEDTGDEVWTKMLELNLLGVVRVCRAAIPHLRGSTHNPAIVTVGSINAHTSFGSEPYSSAKAGITVLTTNLAAALAGDGIRVNAVAPATIRTRVWDGQDGGPDRLRRLYPLGRVGEPEDVANAVAFLASSDADWITGHTLPVDGGLLARNPLI